MDADTISMLRLAVQILVSPLAEGTEWLPMTFDTPVTRSPFAERLRTSDEYFKSPSCVHYKEESDA